MSQPARIRFLVRSSARPLCSLRLSVRDLFLCSGPDVLSTPRSSTSDVASYPLLPTMTSAMVMLRLLSHIPNFAPSPPDQTWMQWLPAIADAGTDPVRRSCAGAAGTGARAGTVDGGTGRRAPGQKAGRGASRHSGEEGAGRPAPRVRCTEGPAKGRRGCDQEIGSHGRTPSTSRGWSTTAQHRGCPSRCGRQLRGRCEQQALGVFWDCTAIPKTHVCFLLALFWPRRRVTATNCCSTTDEPLINLILNP